MREEEGGKAPDEVARVVMIQASALKDSISSELAIGDPPTKEEIERVLASNARSPLPKKEKEEGKNNGNS